MQEDVVKIRSLADYFERFQRVFPLDKLAAYEQELDL